MSSRLIFSALCFIGFAAIASGALYEIGRQRRGLGLISVRHFRWRMFSAVLWMVILVSLGYGIGFSWPRDRSDVETFVRLRFIMNGSMLLMMMASLVFMFDLWLTMKLRQSYQKKTSHDINSFARREIHRLRAEEAASKDAES